MAKVYSEKPLRQKILRLIKKKGLNVNSASKVMSVPQRTLSAFLKQENLPSLRTLQRFEQAVERLKEYDPNKPAEVGDSGDSEAA